MQSLTPQVEFLAARLGTPPAIVLVLAAMLAVLLITTVARAAAWLALGRAADVKLLRRIAGWWLLGILFILVVVLPSPAVLVFTALVSLGALVEYRRLLPPDAADDRLHPLLLLMVPLHYAAVWRFGELALLLVTPVALTVLAVRLIVAQVTEGFVHRLAAAALGWMLLVWSLSFAALLDSPAGATAWFVLLILLTEANDVAASWFGRRLGKARISPRISPKKTWAGTLGGVAATVALSLLLTPPLTGRSHLFALVAGLLVGVVGFFSDLLVSAVKRDAGVKDAGALLPEQGGVLDRADSAILVAPLFYALARFTGA